MAAFVAVGLVFGLAQKIAPAKRAEASRTWKAVVRVDGKRVNKKTIAMKKGSSKQVGLSLVPGQSGANIAYRSNKKTIVSVSGKGRLKARKNGMAKITVTISGNRRKETKVWFKVKVAGPGMSAQRKGTPVVLTVNGKRFQAVFYDNKAAKAVLQKMPVTLTMKELNGNEKYHFFDMEFPTEEKTPGTIFAGDIKLYGSDCFVVFYKSHRTSYSYTDLGKIEDVSGFTEAVGRGTVEITFEK